MLRNLEFPFVAIAALATFSTAGAAEKMRVAYSAWAGHGLLFVPQEKGSFQEDGLDVELALDEATKLLLTALASIQVDILARQHVRSSICEESEKTHGAAWS